MKIRKTNFILPIIFIFITLTISLPAQKYKVLTGGTLINPATNKVIENSIIFIRDSIIVAFGEKIKEKIPENAEIINVKGKFIVPGYIDGHIHFFQSGGLYTRPDALDLRKRSPYADELKWIRDNIDDVFKRYIRCGVTSVIDLGGPYWNFDIRHKAESSPLAPRVFTTGPLIASYQPDALTTNDPPIIKVKTIEEALALVRKELEKKPDFIKVWYVVSKKTSISLEDFFPIVKAIAEETHKHGLKLFVHATELETAKRAIEAGADVLAHNVIDKKVDKEFLKLAKENNVIVIPTMWVFKSYDAVYSKQLKLSKEEMTLGNPKVISSFFDMYDIAYDELGDRQKKLLVEAKPIEIDSVQLQNVKMMQDAGVAIAVGTDAGNVGVVHGPAIYHDFEIMSKAGLTNMQILTDATINAAKLVNKEKLTGSIDKNKLADLVVLNSNPLESIKNTSDIHFTMENGEIFEPEKVLQRTPEDLAQTQLNAYNARDIESFLSVYSEDVEVYKFPDSLRFKGLSEMRNAYANLFDKSPLLHCTLVNRIVIDNYVIDKEKVTGIPERGTVNAAAMYQIENGLIKRVWFLP